MNFKCTDYFLESLPFLDQTFGMFWRFAPMADPYVDEWHSRDLDALMLPREFDAVQEWKNSNRTFHVMRDHPHHHDAILGGMFGIKQNTIESKKSSSDLFYRMIQEFGKKWEKGIDQVALARIVGPHAAADSLVHDSYLCNHTYLNGSNPVAFPTQRNTSLPLSPNFVGNRATYGINLKCPVACRPADHKDWISC